MTVSPRHSARSEAQSQNLPITRHASEIERLLKHNQVIIVAGDTGSGKTTP